MDAKCSTITRAIGLSARDLAEIGGFSDRFARDLIAGRRPFPADVRRAIFDICDDMDDMIGAMVDDVKNGASEIMIFRSNDDLRAHSRPWPKRGHAEGGFVGPHCHASSYVAGMINVDLVFFEPG